VKLGGGQRGQTPTEYLMITGLVAAMVIVVLGGWLNASLPRIARGAAGPGAS
jgi:type IV secretory pathway TrbD component